MRPVTECHDFLCWHPPPIHPLPQQGVRRAEKEDKNPCPRCRRGPLFRQFWAAAPVRMAGQIGSVHGNVSGGEGSFLGAPLWIRAQVMSVCLFCLLGWLGWQAGPERPLGGGGVPPTGENSFVMCQKTHRLTGRACSGWFLLEGG